MRAGERAGARRWSWRCAPVAFALLLTVALAAVAVVLSQMKGSSATKTLRQTVAVVPYWHHVGGVSSVLGNRDTVTMVSPWMYGVGSEGQVTPLGGLSDREVTRQLARLDHAGLVVVPTIANIRNGRWEYGPVARMLHNDALMRRHVSAILALVDSQRLDGVDIDYEELKATDRDAFTRFIQTLAGALHDKHKLVSVDVFAKHTDAGYDERNLAQDYRALGRAADQIRLMAYDYHWSTSAPGPVAPVDWVGQVLAYASTEVPPSKLVLGIPVYGYDWSAGKGSPVTWRQAADLLNAQRVPLRWDRVSRSPWLQYTEGGVEHEVWFEDGASAAAKFDLARTYGIHGVYLWMFGDEDPLIWRQLRDRWRGPIAKRRRAGS